MNYIRYNPVKNIWEIFDHLYAQWNLFSTTAIDESKMRKDGFTILSYSSTWCMNAHFFHWIKPNTAM